MAPAPLSRITLPAQTELDAFARAAGHLLIERQPRMMGSRVVQRRAGTGLQHLDHRDYAPGDEIRYIDWRQTARWQRPIIRRFEAESVTDWTILLDASSSMCARAKWRGALNVAAAMSYALLELGHRVGVLVFGTRVIGECPSAHGQHQYAAIARLLRGLVPARMGETSNLGACAQFVHGTSSVFAVSDFLSEEHLRRDLALVQRRSAALHAVQIGDASETMLSETGELELIDAESGAHVNALITPESSAVAAGRRADLTRGLRSFCAHNGIAFSDWDVAQPWQPMLMRHLIRAQLTC